MPNSPVERLKTATRRYWGYDEFLPLQQEAMECVLNGRDSVVVLPTGGGKSLCYQAPALCVDKLAVVVSPLISLMKDQVDSLVAHGVPAACVNSLMALDERREVADDIRAGRLKLFYVAPERLLSERTLDFLQAVGVSFFAIDEAHCISSWGHDFRPEYRELRQLRGRFPAASLHAFTATATKRVRYDIAEQLGLVAPETLVGSFDRPNLVYRARRREDILGQMCEVLDRYPRQSGIVYCNSRHDVEATSDALNDLGYRTLPYHAGLPDDQRHHHQNAFTREKIDTIVATVAFGMGIDKSDVRYVIHAAMPKSLEAYQQESGRAGRDGLEAECTLFYTGADLMLWKKMLQREENPAPGAQHMFDAMYDYCSAALCRRRILLEYFGESYQIPSCHACDICLGELATIDEPLAVAQKILSCVLRVGERFGGDYVSQVLCGSSDRRIRQHGHDRLSTYGLLESQPKKDVRDWTEQLVSQRFLAKTGDYNVLRVTQSGRGVLRGEVVPKLIKPPQAMTGGTAPPRRKISKARRAAFQLFEQGHTVDDVAARVDRAHSTTVQYLVEYIVDRQVTDSSAWVAPATAARIVEAMGRVGSSDRLAPIRAALDGEISYEHIRIVLHCHRNAQRRATAGTSASRAVSGRSSLHD